MSVVAIHSESGWRHRNAYRVLARPVSGQPGYSPGPDVPGFGACGRGCRSPFPELAFAWVSEWCGFRRLKEEEEKGEEESGGRRKGSQEEEEGGAQPGSS